MTRPPAAGTRRRPPGIIEDMPPPPADLATPTPPGGVVIPSNDRERRRFEAYCRWSLHVLLAFGAFILTTAGGVAVHNAVIGTGLSSAAGSLAVAFAVTLIVWLVVCSVVVEVRTRGREAHRALVVAFVVLGVVVTVVSASLLTMPTAASSGLERGNLAYLGPVPLAIGGSIALLLWPRRPVLLGLVGGLALLFAIYAWGPPRLGVSTAIGLTMLSVWICLLLSPTAPLTAWMIGVVRRLADAQQVAADLAVAQERLRFSRDLHDVFGRTLSSVAIKSELAAELARRGDDRAVGEMTAVRDLAQSALAEVRGVVRGYRSIDLAEEVTGARSVLRAAGIRTSAEGFDDPDLAALTDLVGEAGCVTLAWVVREGVTNVLRHGHAVSADLTLERTGDGATLTLASTTARVVSRPQPPTGSEARGAEAGGSGLVGLRERLDAVGGTLEAGPAESHSGYLLRAHVPTSAPVSGASA